MPHAVGNRPTALQRAEGTRRGGLRHSLGRPVSYPVCYVCDVFTGVLRVRFQSVTPWVNISIVAGRLLSSLVPVTRTNTLYVFANPVVSYCVVLRFETITLYPANALCVNIYTGVVCPHSKMRGCSCFRAISVDGQYDVEYSKMISAFFYNDTSNTTELFSDEYLHKFYR
jgi:hypothetical protein